MENSYKTSVSGIELTITNTIETLRMGGPYVGDVSIESDLVSKDCIVNNFVYKKAVNLLFFVKYHEINFYKYFTINFYNIDTKTVYEFSREFEMVHLKEFVSENQLHIFLSFNDQSGNNFYFNLDEEEFKEVN